MPFFDPLPPEPPLSSSPQPTGWRPPAWDRPSEALLGAVVPTAIVLAKNDELALLLDDLHAYPNGFSFVLAIQRNPMAPRVMDGPMSMGMGHPMHRRGPRLRLEFPDGARVHDPWHRPGGPLGFLPGRGVTQTAMLSTGRGAPGPTNPFGVPTDELGIPTVPVLLPRGGGGGGERFTIGYWCFPLPPAGTVDVYVEWADQDIAETSAPLDATLIRDASERVVELWEPDV